MVERCPQSPIRERALYVMASAVAGAGRRDEAVALYRRFAREAPESTLADDALFAAAELQARDGRPDQARATLEALLAGLPAGDRRDEARFRLAWMAWRAGEGERAVAELQRLDADADPEDAYEHARAAYWRGRILAERGEAGRVEARALWSAPRRGGAGRLLRPPRAGPPRRAPGRGAARAAGPGRRPAAVAPERAVAPLAGDRAPPGRRWRSCAPGSASRRPRSCARSTAPPRRPGDLGPLVGLAELLARAGDHHAAHGLLRLSARAELRRPPEGPVRRVWEVAYPQAFAEEVARAAGPAGVPPELLLALMREESALDPGGGLAGRRRGAHPAHARHRPRGGPAPPLAGARSGPP